MDSGFYRRRIEIPYQPRRQFVPFHTREQRWACMVAHRRAGKTVACVNELIRSAMCGSTALTDARYAYVAPYYSQAKDIAWTYLKRFSSPIPGHTVNESELRIDYPNGARVRLYGADNYDRLRGGYLDGVVLDEYADMSPAAWGEVIRPMLADRKGWACFIGTPKGRNAFWQIWETAQTDPTYFALMLKASQTGLVDNDELAAAQRDMTPEQYAQEFECSFDAAILGAFYGQCIAEAERDGRIIELPGTELPVHTAWDLGMDDPTAIWFFQVAPDGLRILDYYENSGHALEHYVDELRSRGYTYGDHWLPHDAKVAELVSGRTRVEFLQTRLPGKCRLIPNHQIMDGINAARVSFKQMWFDGHKCRLGLEALRQYHAEYDDKLRTFKLRPRHDWTSHAADAFRYLAMAWKEMRPSQITKPKPEELTFYVEQGKLKSTMNVRDWVEMKKRKREANG